MNPTQWEVWGVTHSVLPGQSCNLDGGLEEYGVQERIACPGQRMSPRVGEMLPLPESCAVRCPPRTGAEVKAAWSFS